jgi:hypothetical protein
MVARPGVPQSRHQSRAMMPAHSPNMEITFRRSAVRYARYARGPRGTGRPGYLPRTHAAVAASAALRVLPRSERGAGTLDRLIVASEDPEPGRASRLCLAPAGKAGLVGGGENRSGYGAGSPKATGLIEVA